MRTEIERRFLVLSMQSGINLGQRREIVQGYFEIPFPEQSLRIRIINNKRAFVAKKEGFGVSREEKEHPIALGTAKLLLECCTHFIEKTRYHYRGWSIDFFHSPLSGIVVAEKEVKNPNQKVKLPFWIHQAMEITESISNLHLARLATDLRGTNTEPLMAVYEILSKKISKIVLTGGSCSGKSTLMKTIRKEMENLVHCVPEVASIVISQVGIKPPVGDPIANRRLQRTIYRVQRIFEATSAEYALNQGKQVLVLDRGTVDNAAYMPGGLKEMENTYQTTRQFEYSQYDLVICLEVPPEDIFEKNRLNNPARSEPYSEVLDRSQQIKEVWKDHPNFHFIPNCKSWEEKENKVLVIIQEFLSKV